MNRLKLILAKDIKVCRGRIPHPPTGEPSTRGFPHEGLGVGCPGAETRGMFPLRRGGVFSAFHGAITPFLFKPGPGMNAHLASIFSFAAAGNSAERPSLFVLRHCYHRQAIGSIGKTIAERAIRAV
jgi:hypothetical protein